MLEGREHRRGPRRHGDEVGLGERQDDQIGLALADEVDEVIGGVVLPQVRDVPAVHVEEVGDHPHTDGVHFAFHGRDDHARADVLLAVEAPDLADVGDLLERDAGGVVLRRDGQLSPSPGVAYRDQRGRKDAEVDGRGLGPPVKGVGDDPAGLVAVTGHEGLLISVLEQCRLSALFQALVHERNIAGL